MTSVPWIEKYRPKDVSEVASQFQVVNMLKSAIATKNLPHLLFYGPPGTGKTSAILAAAHELYRDDYKTRVLELNSSDERGIQVVREKIKTFAQGAVTVSKTGSSVPFKLIILDEADSMTHDAQAALRRIIEKHSKVTRFCLIGNYISRIIEPLASRCAKFRFLPLDYSTAASRLRMIIEAEKTLVGDKALHTLIDCSQGDLRRAIMTLQCLCHLAKKEEITCEMVREQSGNVPEDALQTLRGSWEQSFAHVQRAVESLHQNGYPGGQIIQQLHDCVVSDAAVSERQKAKICMLLADADHAIASGADEQLQVLSASLGARQVMMTLS